MCILFFLSFWELGLDAMKDWDEEESHFTRVTDSPFSASSNCCTVSKRTPLSKKKGAAISDIIQWQQNTVHCYSRFEGRVAWQLLLTELAVGVVAVLKLIRPELLYSQPQRQPQWWSFSTKATCNGYAYCYEVEVLLWFPVPLLPYTSTLCAASGLAKWPINGKTSWFVHLQSFLSTWGAVRLRKKTKKLSFIFQCFLDNLGDGFCASRNTAHEFESTIFRATSTSSAKLWRLGLWVMYGSSWSCPLVGRTVSH